MELEVKVKLSDQQLQQATISFCTLITAGDRESSLPLLALSMFATSIFANTDRNVEALSVYFGQTLKLSYKARRKLRDRSFLEDVHLDIITRRQAEMREFFIDEEDFLDPRYDFDFTDLSDLSPCWRGDEGYERPKGWYRIALKVKGKYPDGDEWLGTNGWGSHSAVGEWPVCYHGTTLDGAKSIIRSHFKAGNGSSYGRGIYSTPNIYLAERDYAQIFRSKTTGKRYKVVLQNRINPEWREICPDRDFWLIPIPRETSPRRERRIAQAAIRPYGILIRRV